MHLVKKIKVAFILPNLSPGGAERVMSFVAQNINKDDFCAVLWVISKPTDKDYKIEGIELKYLHKTRVLKSIFILIKNLRQYKPDIVISSISHLNMMMGFISFLFPRIKFIGREANVLSVLKSLHGKKTRSNFWFKVSYLALDKILCTSKDMMEDFIKVYRFPVDKLEIINNPISRGFENKLVNSKEGGMVQFITVGSLKRQKGHIRILSALSKLDIDFTYSIIGDGVERANILSEISKLGLEKKVKHIQYSNEVQIHLSESSLFLQGAYVEGFPNCLLESAAIGLPIVAFNAPGGLNEIVKNGFNGYIANSETEFVAFIHKSLGENVWKHEEIAKYTRTKYGSEAILKKYENLLKNIVK